MKRILVVGYLVIIGCIPLLAKSPAKSPPKSTTKTTSPKKSASKAKTSDKLAAKKYADRIHIITKDIENMSLILNADIGLENYAQKTQSLIEDNVVLAGADFLSVRDDPQVMAAQKESDDAHLETIKAQKQLLAQIARIRSVSPVPNSCRKADALFIRYSTETETALNGIDGYDPGYKKMQLGIEKAKQYLTQGLSLLTELNDSAVTGKKYVNG